MQPVVEVEIKGKSLQIIPDFGMLSAIEKILGTGIFAISQKRDQITLENLRDVFDVCFPGHELKKDEINDYIFDNYQKVYGGLIEIIQVSFRRSLESEKKTPKD